ncbi:type II toxin-antitoxin system VapC family toxin [Patescibacteria group bacterium]|nr:type II toxin-antitoxin system VapC family toxin [Patescibacteria group bacterium]
MKYLVDSDFLISFSSDLDSTHQKSVEIYKKIKDGSKLVALNLVFQESTTVVSKKFGMQKAKIFYEMINKFINTRIIMNEDVEKEAWKMFLQQSKKGTSFIDCANLAAYKKYKLDGILSFDEFYSKHKITYPKDARINLV